MYYDKRGGASIMRFILRLIKNIIAIVAMILIVYLALRYAPFLKDQPWNPVNEHERPIVQEQEAAQGENGGTRYIVKDNDILNNIPLSQVRKVFEWLDKSEFMSVTGLERMGYNDEYLAGQRENEYIIYKFGSDSLRVYATELEMQQDLQELDEYIPLKYKEAYE